MTFKAQVISPSDDGLKSIPISSFQNYPAAWRQVTGRDPNQEHDVYYYYERVPWLRRGVDLICDAVAGMPRKFVRGETELEEKQADVVMNWSSLLNELVGDLVLYHAAYFIIETNQFHRNPQLTRLHPTTMTPEFKGRQGMVGFIRTIDGRETFYKPEEIGWIHLPNRRYEVGVGSSRAQAALNASGILLNSDLHASNTFKQGALNVVMLFLEGFTKQPDAEQERVKNWLQRMVSGVKNAAKVLPTGTKPEAVTLSQPLKDLALPELTQVKREDIATALGVPHSKLFSNAANFATAREDNTSFYEDNVIPLGRELEMAINRYLELNKIGYTLKFHPDEMTLFQEDERQRSFALFNYVNAGMSLPLALEILGVDLPDGMTYDQVEVVPKQPSGFGSSDPEGHSLDGGAIDASEKSITITPPPLPILTDDLGKWENKALNRLKASKSMAFDFITEQVSKPLKAAIAEALQIAETVADVKAIFASVRETGDAHGWDGY